MWLIVWSQGSNRSVPLFPEFASINMAEVHEKMKLKQSNEAPKTKISEVNLPSSSVVTIIWDEWTKKLQIVIHAVYLITGCWTG